MDEVIGLIPAAGKGTRLGLPYPKELWPLPGQQDYLPVGLCSVELLRTAGITRIGIVTSQDKPAIMGYFGGGSRFGVEIIYACQEVYAEKGKSAGLLQAIDSAYPVIQGRRVAFVMPDTYIHPKDAMSQLIAGAAAADLTLGLFPTDKPHKFGMVRTEGTKVLEIIDKPAQTDLKLMWGLLLWSPRFSDYLRSMREVAADFASLMNGAIAERMDVRAVQITEGKYLDFGTYDDVLLAEEFIKSLDREGGIK